jgi:signal peptide peptidase SppA
MNPTTMPQALSPGARAATARWLGFWRRRTIVPAVRLAGVIGSLPLRSGGMTLAGLERALAAAFSVKRAPAVVLLLNSPGGSPVQSALIAGRIRQLAKEKGKPVLAFAEDVAASGGYWLACAADEIFAMPGSIVGSIGVVSAGFGFSEAIGRLGIERRMHTAGTRKAILDPFQPERPDDVAVLREIQDELHEQFKAAVRTSRGGRLRASDEELFNGRFWTAERGLGLGLVDGLGDARAVVRERFGDHARIKVLNQPRGWLQRRLRLQWQPDQIAAGVMSTLEERALWQRFGL